jgi:two-component system OmpR family response regulator
MSATRPPFDTSSVVPTAQSSRRHILVIDDEQPILDLLQEYLSAQGYRVSTASNAQQAKNVVEREAPSLIITDLQLEDTDGLHLIEQLRVLLPATPVILLTGVLFDSHVIEENLQWKISSYISKTAPLQTLVQEIKRLLIHG